MNLLEKDIALTLENKKKLLENKNLLYWYKKSYDEIFSRIKNTNSLNILEIGSGTSPIKLFYPNIKTSDIMPLEFIDYVFDALEIDSSKELGETKFDIITFTNVLHHLKKPIDFIEKCKKRLKENGKIIFLEPYFSITSSFIYKYIHHEATDMKIQKPEIERIEGPLSTSNIALPYLIFFKNKTWLHQVEKNYRISRINYFTSIAYFFTGGISYKLPIPSFIYKILFGIDYSIAKLFPKLLGTFFILELTKKEN